MKSISTRHVIAALALACSPATAHAAEWWLVTPENNVMIFADAHSVVDKGNGIRIAWLRADKLVGLKMLYHQFTRAEINCVDHSMKALQSRLLHIDPQFNEERKAQSSPTFAHPGSETWEIIDFVCGYGPDAARDGKFGIGVKLPPDLSEVPAFVEDRRKKWIAKYGYDDDPPAKRRTTRE